MAQVIGIDIGYGFTKSITVSNDILKKTVFSTIVSSYAPNFSFGGKIPTILVNGDLFAIGEDLVLNGIPYENTTRGDFVGSPSYMAVIGYTLAFTNFHGKVMVLGLPPIFFQKEKNKELIEKIREQWFVDELGKPILVPETIKVVPQGAGIFFSCANKYPEIIKKNVLVIDMGYHTLDIVFFSSGKYIEGLAASFPMGTKRIYDQIRNEFSKTFGIFAKGDKAIEELIKYGKYYHLGKEYSLDVKPILESARKMIFTTLKGHIEKVVSTIDYAFAGGGGAWLLKDEERGINLVEDPQFANAVGFYQYGRQFIIN